MRNKDSWQESKFSLHKGRLRSSRDTREVGASSFLIGDLIAKYYGKYLPEYASGRLVDLGCGKAPLYLAYKDLVSEVTLVDWANSLHRNDLLDYELDLTEPLSLNSESYDTVILSDVLEHIPNPGLLFSEIYRILSKGGLVLLNVPFFYWLHEKPYDYYRYTEFALKRLTEQAGFQTLLLEPIGGVPEIMTDIFGKEAKRIPFIGNLIARLACWVCECFVSTKFGSYCSRKTAMDFPFAYFMVLRKSL